MESGKPSLDNLIHFFNIKYKKLIFIQMKMKSLDELNKWIDSSNATRSLEMEERVEKVKNFASENKDLVGKMAMSLAGGMVSYYSVEISKNLSVGFEASTVLRTFGCAGMLGSVGYGLFNAGKLAYKIFKKN